MSALTDLLFEGNSKKDNSVNLNSENDSLDDFDDLLEGDEENTNKKKKTKNILNEIKPVELNEKIPAIPNLPNLEANKNLVNTQNLPSQNLNDLTNPVLQNSIRYIIDPKFRNLYEKKEINFDEDTREIVDIDKIRNFIYKNVIQAFQNLPPVENQRYKLVFSDLKYVDPETYPIEKLKEAILRNETLKRRLRGNLILIDKQTGQPVSQKTVTLAEVPYLTQQGTFIINGNAYTLSHQFRLRPGIFHRVKDNGEIEAHVNVDPNQGGFTHRYFLEPKSGIFKLSIGQSKLPLFPLLKALGASEEELKNIVGEELYLKNSNTNDPQEWNKLYEKIVRKKLPGLTPEQKKQAVIEELNKVYLDPEVTTFTLGKPFNRLSKEAILLSVKKLLSLSRGEEEPDDRDALEFQQILGPEDLIAERVRKALPNIRAALWKITNTGDLNRWPRDAVTKEFLELMFDSGLGQTPEQTNPLHILDLNYRVSRLGYGGIPSIESVPEEARNVQPSHLNFVDFVIAPENLKIGVDARLASHTRKGINGKLYSLFKDLKTGKPVWKTSNELKNEVIVFPGEMDNELPVAAALKNGKIMYVPKDQVTLEPFDFENSFTAVSNLVPIKNANKAQRLSMGVRFLIQALPLKEPESPLVKSALPEDNNKSYDEYYAKYVGNVYSENKPGRVAKVTPTSITVKYDDGEVKQYDLYSYFPFNRKTYLHNTPLVSEGDKVQPNQLLAKSNYSDDSGAVALGKNLRTAYIPFRGLNYEDAFVISETAAKKLTSEHMYQNVVELDDSIKTKKNFFVSLFPSVFNREILNKLDDDGVVKPGTVLNYGDPIILVAKAQPLDYKRAYSSHKGAYADESILWDHHSEGIVTDVAKTKKGYTVTVRTSLPAQVGDKIAGRYGDKGIISAIIPDEEMPHDEEGKPYEVLANPLIVISRANAAQVVEGALGKIAALKNQAYKLPNWLKIKNWIEFAEKELQKNGLSSTETVIDPNTGKKIPNIFTGVRYFLKLHHTSESKDQGRGIGGYTWEETPAKGGDSGSKRLALMDVNALLSHGATDVLRDAKLVRGQKNQEYWSLFMRGHNPPSPKVPLVYEKFINQLKASGINVLKGDNYLHVFALTDKDIDELAGNRNLTNAETINWNKGMIPINGGLFDQSLTGGHEGNRWAAIVLAERMPNPVMEEPIRRVLGLTEKQFRDVLAGKQKLNNLTGPDAIYQALASINLNAEIQKAKADVMSSRKSIRDAAVRKLGFLSAAAKANIHPKDWMLKRFPVIPPIFRPLSYIQQTGQQLISDPNYLYRDMWFSNETLASLKDKVSDLAEERLNLYDSMKAVVGLGDPVQAQTRSKNIKGFLKQIFGNNPKYGTVQQKLLGTTVDLVGRAVVAPDSSLGLDEIGLPEQKAWEVYFPFIIRRLVRKGLSPLAASDYAEKRNEVARQALLEELEERPVLVNRAPVLHRYGLLAFWPRLIKGDVLKVNPTVVSGFNMDFDGDTSNYHVPATEEAKQEAIAKMLPSRNLFSVQLFRAHYLPRQEYIVGLYEATKSINKKKNVKTFATMRDVLKAFFRGEIDTDQPVNVLQV